MTSPSTEVPDGDYEIISKGMTFVVTNHETLNGAEVYVPARWAGKMPGKKAYRVSVESENVRLVHEPEDGKSTERLKKAEADKQAALHILQDDTVPIELGPSAYKHVRGTKTQVIREVVAIFTTATVRSVRGVSGGEVDVSCRMSPLANTGETAGPLGWNVVAVIDKTGGNITVTVKHYGQAT